jgi:transcription-repair coupling factor (superfamily II helicase)
MLPTLVAAVRRLPGYRALRDALPAPGRALGVRGLPGSSPAVVLAALAQDHPQRVFLVVTPHPVAAETWLADLGVLLPDVARLYPQREALGEEEPHLEIAGERIETIAAMLAGAARIVVTTLRALLERTGVPDQVRALRMAVKRGDRIEMPELLRRLEAMGYERRPTVFDVAQYAVRGGIVDLYGFGMAAPTRLEWWGDELISLRAFDLDTQRSEGEVDIVTILPSSRAVPAPEPAAATGDRVPLFDLLPTGTVILVDGAVDGTEPARVWEEAEHHLAVARRRGEEVPGRGAVLLSPEEWASRWDGEARIVVRETDGELNLAIVPPPAIERRISRVVDSAARGPVMVLCDNEGQLERLEELVLEERRGGLDLPPALTLALGALHGGFALPDLVVLTDHEVFERPRRLRRPRRYRQALATSTVGALTAGDYVVHLEHGIGIYRGIEQIAVGDGGAIDVAVVEYEGGDRLNVPLYGMDQLEPYRTGADDGQRAAPRLHRLGGKRWRGERHRTEVAIREMAAELLELQARRTLAAGFPFPPDTKWQRELESAFLYEDTPDQRRATDETKRDMERPRPMDRLIVGDVGYGKTEVAVRAAFKAVQAGKQVAVLVPTTILAEQHGRTFRERLADYPVTVEVLSRFRTAAEQRDALARLTAGTVDVVVGTHRLLSPDVAFHELGLLVVDEEHRFGVRHKERLKALRLEVDVLTLTATPIPRTLHGALAGLRDLTMIETPPRDRSPVLTFIEPWDDELLREAVARELDRGGQVFFVHNRIETIEPVAERVRRLASRARVAVAHGKLKERELDQVMRRFVTGEVQVLVSTMIVESGLDVPNANTMIVHDAQHLGLAQLYQLRGRVGRGHRRAYCYLLVPDLVDEEAERRLKVLEHHTELGAGYRIALRDLEIRGAGNLLGAEQSGHAYAVGMDLYLRWLDDTVRALRGDAGGRAYPPPDVTFDGPAHLSDGYVPDEDAKLDVYRRLARAQELGEIAALRAELKDRFGPPPPEAERLLEVAELRAIGARLGLGTVIVRGDDARLKFRPDAAPRLMRLRAALEDVQFAADVRQAVPLSLKLRRLGGLPIGSGLVRALGAVLAVETERWKDGRTER